MRTLLTAITLAFTLVSVAAVRAEPEKQMQVIAELPQRPTGVAVAPDGRVFVSLPFSNYSDPEKFVGSVVVLGANGEPRPYPDAAWNANPATSTTAAEHRFLNVQSHTIAGGTLWALDRGRPRGGPVVPGGAKLVGIDLATGAVIKAIIFDEAFARDNFLNDVRVDARRQVAYVTDTGNGGVILVDLNTGAQRWALRAGPWMAFESRDPVAEGVTIAGDRRRATPRTADGLALSADGNWLYLQGHPWVAPVLYRVPTATLRDPALTGEAVSAKVERVGTTVFSDGIELDAQGRVYFTDYEADAITRREPNGRLTHVVADRRLSWPDAIAFGPDGSMYATVAQFHRVAAANNGVDRSTPPFIVVRVPDVVKPQR